VNCTDEWVHYEDPEEVFRQLDARTILRVALDLVEDPQLPVRYKLDDLLTMRLLERGFPLCDEAREERRKGVARDVPLVVLTAGSSDSQLLAEAVSVTHPHLVGFLRRSRVAHTERGTGRGRGRCTITRLRRER
jgi:hypothetical protein